MDIVSIVTCGISMLIVCYMLYLEFWVSRKKTVDNLQESTGAFKIIQQNHKIVFWLLLILAVVLRVWKLGIIPGGLNQDSALSALDAQALIKYGTDRLGMRYPVHFTAWTYSQQSAMLDYLLVPVFALFGVSQATMAIPSLVVSIVGMLVFYKLIKEIWGEMPALLAFFIVCFNPWHFIQSRWSLDANLFPHFFIMGLFLLIKGLKQTKFIFISMVIFGLSHYCYGVSLYTVPVFLLLFCIYLFYKKVISVKTVIISILIYLVVSLPFFLAMVFSALGLPEITTPLITIPSFTKSIRGGDLLFFSEHPWRTLKENAEALFSLVVLQKSDHYWNAVPTFGTVYRCMIPFSFLGVYYLVKLIKREENSVQRAKYIGIAIYGAVAFVSGFITMIVNTWRINIFHYMHMCLVLFGLLFVWEKSKRLFSTAILLLLCMNVLFIATYFTSFAKAWSGPECYSYHLKGALEYIADKECDVYYITTDTQYDGSADVSEIYTMFVHDLDALYCQGKTNQSNDRNYFPYKVQYQYIKAGDLDNIDVNKKAIYLINYYDRDLFPKEYFHEEAFDPYFVEIPLAIYE